MPFCCATISSARPSLSTSASTANSTLPPPLISISCQSADPPALPGVLPPRDLAGEPGHVGEIGIAVAVDVDRHQAEAVDVVAGESDLAKLVLRPGWRLVPELAADEIEPAIAIDVGDGGGFAGAGIDQVRSEWNIGRTALSGHRQRDNYQTLLGSHRCRAVYLRTREFQHAITTHRVAHLRCRRRSGGRRRDR